MEVVIVHPLLEIGGGAEKLAIEMHRALAELGFESRIATYYLDWERLAEVVGLLSPGFKPLIEARPLPPSASIVDLLARALTGDRLTRLRRALLTSILVKNIKREAGGGVVVDTASHVPTPVDVAYIHVPLITPSGRRGFVWRSYETLLKRLADSVTGRPRLVLVNSSWTRAVFHSVYGDQFRVEVVHPPVDVEYFESLEEKREKAVVTVSRFSPEKNLGRVVEVAGALRDYDFYIVGSATRKGLRYAGYLKRLAEERGLGNVHVLPNLPRSRLRDLLRTALFYLHPPYAEHFGLSVAEAVSAGAIPIVYRDGGAWFDIVSRISPALGYTEVGEVPSIVRRVEGDPALARALRERGLSVVREFDFESFKKRLSKAFLSCCPPARGS